MKTVIVSGNCQAQFLTTQFNLMQVRTPVRFLYSKDFENPFFPTQKIEEADWRGCDVLLLQVGSWENRTVPFDMLAPGVQIVKFPQLALDPAWPLGVRDKRNESLPVKGFEAYPFGAADRVALRLIRELGSEAKAFSAYMRMAVTKEVDIDRFFEVFEQKMEAIDRKADIHLWPFIASNFRKRKLFHTRNHPNGVIMARLFAALVENSRLKDWAENPREIADRILCGDGIDDTEDQIHPQVAEHLGMKWLDGGTKFRFWQEGSFDFSRRIRRYMRFQYNVPLLLLRRAILGRRLGEAKAHAVDAMAYDPDNWFVNLSVGEMYVKMEAPHAALHYLRRSLELSRRERGASWYTELRPRAAARSSAKREWMIHQQIAFCMLAMKRFDEASHAIEVALKLGPDRAVGHFLKGRILDRLRRNDLARAAYERAAWLEPRNPVFVKAAA